MATQTIKSILTKDCHFLHEGNDIGYNKTNQIY